MGLNGDTGVFSDDTLEGQLGYVLFFPEVVDVSVFGSKTDRNLTGQPAALPRDGAGAAALVSNARHGLERLLGADPALLRSAGARLRALLGAQAHAGPEAMAGWPAPIPTLAARLYAEGVPVHVLPISGGGSLTSSRRRPAWRRRSTPPSSPAWHVPRSWGRGS